MGAIPAAASCSSIGMSAFWSDSCAPLTATAVMTWYGLSGLQVSLNCTSYPLPLWP
jgi:hypothetical protein